MAKPVQEKLDHIITNEKQNNATYLLKTTTDI